MRGHADRPDVDCRDRRQLREAACRNLGRRNLSAHLVAACPGCPGCVRRARQCRQFWFGAALFGIGFLFLVHNDPPFAVRESRMQIPTVVLLEAIRPRFETLVATLAGDPDSAPANARIRRALTRRVPMRFTDKTTLEEVVHFIEEAAAVPTARASRFSSTRSDCWKPKKPWIRS